MDIIFKLQGAPSHRAKVNDNCENITITATVIDDPSNLGVTWVLSPDPFAASMYGVLKNATPHQVDYKPVFNTQNGTFRVLAYLVATSIANPSLSRTFVIDGRQ